MYETLEAAKSRSDYNVRMCSNRMKNGPYDWGTVLAFLENYANS